MALVVSVIVLIVAGSPSWGFKPLLVPAFVVWAVATALDGWEIWRPLFG